MKKSIYKVPAGKLLKIFLEDEDGKIINIKITGDFFMHPEENLEKLEQYLIGAELSEEILLARIEEFLKFTPTEFFGLDKASLVSTILAAK